MTEETIAMPSYHERMWGLTHRKFQLGQSSLSITGHANGSRIDLQIDLATISPNSQRVWSRTKHFRWASGMLFAVVFPVVFVLANTRPDLSTSLFFSLLISAVIPFFLASLRRKEYRIFLHHSGVASFDIWKSGPDSARFEEFVLSVQTRINQLSSPGAAP